MYHNTSSNSNTLEKQKSTIEQTSPPISPIPLPDETTTAIEDMNSTTPSMPLLRITNDRPSPTVLNSDPAISSIPTAITATKYHRLPNEILLKILSYVFHFPGKTDEDASTISASDFKLLISPSGSLTQCLSVSKDFAAMSLEALYTHNMIDLSKSWTYHYAFPPVNTRHFLRRLELIVRVTDRSNCPSETVVKGIQYTKLRASWGFKVFTVNDLLDHTPGWKHLKYLTDDSIGFSNLKHLKLRLRVKFQYQNTDVDTQELLRFLEVVEKAGITIKAADVEFEGPRFFVEGCRNSWRFEVKARGSEIRIGRDLTGRDIEVSAPT
ncbi:hypothetical protein K505DRAFT_360066 [Melanomma pulvis-pyrius CBS 109.77]|uniref:F-box domain-containing protein n=1 Tax=Melanomma pulvis-pyrius CBS 109.77 TaxID=1314802 RepID=A0A6A6XG44_9PLEO|nr:hypothetical protein K505DRAFT_360066 [Melanomma pulvis-pyrius CBS 109.77]